MSLDDRLDDDERTHAREIELEISTNCLVTGFFDRFDDSFDHAFGTKVERGWELIRAIILVWIDDAEYDVTESIKGKQRELFATKIIEEARKTLEGPVRDAWDLYC